jgi:hypothetical protein
VPAGGLIFISLAVPLVLRSTTLDRRIATDTRAQSLQPVPTLIASHSLIPPPSIELPDGGLDRVRMPPAAFAPMMARPAPGQMVKRRAQRRSPPSVSRTHTAFARDSDAFWRPYSAHFGPAVDGDAHY